MSRLDRVERAGDKNSCFVSTKCSNFIPKWNFKPIRLQRSTNCRLCVSRSCWFFFLRKHFRTHQRGLACNHPAKLHVMDSNPTTLILWSHSFARRRQCAVHIALRGCVSSSPLAAASSRRAINHVRAWFSLSLTKDKLMTEGNTSRIKCFFVVASIDIGRFTRRVLENTKKYSSSFLLP